MRCLVKAFLTWGLLCVVSLLGFRGCGTAGLIHQATQADPLVSKVYAAYHRGDAIIFDYAVGTRITPQYSILPGRYWACFPFPANPENLEMGKEFEIHRQPLPPDVVFGWRPIPVIDLKEHLQPKQNGFYSFDDAFAYLGTIPNDQLPVFSFLLAHDWDPAQPKPPELDASFSNIVYVDPRNGKRITRTCQPYATYIPREKYRALIIYWPFAVLWDWVTLPLLFFAPHIEG